MNNNKCPKCGGELECLGGCSAHPNNWYCKDEKGCGWQAWQAWQAAQAEQKELIAELAEATTCARSQLLMVINDINKDRVSFDGDDFHETLEKCDKALAKAKADK